MKTILLAVLFISASAGAQKQKKSADAQSLDSVLKGVVHPDIYKEFDTSLFPKRRHLPYTFPEDVQNRTEAMPERSPWNSLRFGDYPPTIYRGNGEEFPLMRDTFLLGKARCIPPEGNPSTAGKAGGCTGVVEWMEKQIEYLACERAQLVDVMSRANIKSSRRIHELNKDIDSISIKKTYADSVIQNLVEIWARLSRRNDSLCFEIKHVEDTLSERRRYIDWLKNTLEVQNRRVTELQEAYNRQGAKLEAMVSTGDSFEYAKSILQNGSGRFNFAGTVQDGKIINFRTIYPKKTR